MRHANARTILAATDFSAPARHAADRAARIAHECRAALVLMHVMPSTQLEELRGWLGQDHATERALETQAREQLDRLAAEIHAQRHVETGTSVLSGAAPDAIARVAAQVDASLVVVGAKGAGFLRRLLLGSTSERLLRRTLLPVLVVRQAAHEPYRRVLVAVDFSEWSLQAVAEARRVAPHAQVVLMHAFEVPFESKLQFAGVDAATIDRYRERTRAEALQRVHDVAAAAGLRTGAWQPCVVEGHAARCVLEQEVETDCDLVVLGKHGQSVTEELLLGSVTRQVLAEGTVDVLVSTARAA